MAGSQKSFESILNRFVDGLALLQSWGDYNPNNNLIKVANLLTFTNNVKTANLTTSDALVDLNTKQDNRVLKCFIQKGNINPDCLEARIRGIRNYLKGENFPEAEVRAVEKILRHIHPYYPKKTPVPPGEPQPRHPSPSERSFAALIADGHAIINRITALGVAYTPPDSKLTVAEMTTLINDIIQLSKDVQLALDVYGTAVRARKKLYTGPGSLNERTMQVTNYLSSFPGQKKSNHAIEFKGAIKGT